MQHTLTRILSLALMVLAASVPALAQAVGQPKLAMTYELEPPVGKVKGTLTAPLTDNQQRPLPENARLSITVTRSCYALNQNDLVVCRFADMAPGESREFTDDITPAWEFNQQYTYTAVASLSGFSFYAGYGTMTPGLAFNFEFGGFTLTPSVDGNSVELKAEVPYRNVDGEDLPVPVSAIEFYRATDTSGWPYRYELINTVSNPEPQSTVVYVDASPEPDKVNNYMVRAVTPYGYAQATDKCYVGLDIPAAPYTVEARQVPEGVLVSWSVPERGENWGAIDPADIWYNVFRCRGYGAAERELIASQIKETSFVDTGEGLESPQSVRYEVQAGNSKGEGGSNFNSYDFDILIGPAYTLPFRDTFDGGFTKEWSLTNTDYYAKWYAAEEGEYGSRPIRVKPVQGSGLVYVDYVYNSPKPESKNTMTSYKIDLSGADNPVASFWYYAIPDNDVSITLDYSADNVEFTNPYKITISEGVTKAEWRRVFVPMPGLGGLATAYVRLTTTFLDVPSSAIIDDFSIIDYPRVQNLKAEVDDSAMSVSLTWSMPGDEGAAVCTGFIGYADGVEQGEVTSPWVVTDLEYGRAYTFAVRALYENVEVNVSEPVEVLISKPAPEAFSDASYDYKVLPAAEGEDWPVAVVVAGYHGKGGILRMPAAVTYEEHEYKVEGVEPDVFAGNDKVSSVSMPEGYLYVGARAFRGVVALAALSIPESMKEIGEEAFSGCSALRAVNFAGVNPPVVGKDAFSGVAEDCKGTCPEESKDKYAATENLQALFGYLDGVDQLIGAAGAEVEYYTLTGIRIAAPVRGECSIVRITLPSGEVKSGVVRF